MADEKAERFVETAYASSGRSSNERDGACICDYNPDTTDGPQEDCPFHGRPYAYWIERGDVLAARLERVEAVARRWESVPKPVVGWNSGLSATESGNRLGAWSVLQQRAADLRAALADPVDLTTRPGSLTPEEGSHG